MMLMRNLAVELGPHRITVNNIAPGAIETPINRELLEDKKKLGALLEKIPLGRLGQPEMSRRLRRSWHRKGRTTSPAKRS